MSEALGFDPTATAPKDEDSTPRQGESTSPLRGDYTNVEPLAREEIRIGNVTIEKTSYPTSIPFSIYEMAEETPVDVVITVRSDNGDSYTLNDQLPSGVVLVEKVGQLSAVSGSKERYIVIPRRVSHQKSDPLLDNYVIDPEKTTTDQFGGVSFNFFDAQNSLIMVEHEIGHTNSRLRSPERSQRREAIEKKIRRQSFAGDEITLTPEEENEYLDVVVREEREAWKWALDDIRAARDKGVDLTAGLGQSGVLRLVDAALSDYELDNERFKHPGPNPSQEAA